MHQFLRTLPLPAKLMLIGLIPFCFLILLTVGLYREKNEKLAQLHDYKNYMQESAAINGLIDALQEERKYSFDYAITKNNREQLLRQRPKTDAYIKQLEKSANPTIEGFKTYTKIGEIAKVRFQIDHFKIGPDLVMHFYSNTIFRLNTLNTIPPANTSYLRPVYQDLMAQKILSEMITYLGIIRSNIYNVLNTKQYMVETLVGTVGTHDVYKSYEQELLEKASPHRLKQYQNIQQKTALQPTTVYMERLFKVFKFDDSLTAAQWWQISDQGTNELRKFQNEIWDNIHQKIDAIYQREKDSRNQTLIFLIIALTCVVVSVTYIMRLITDTLEHLRDAAEKIANGETAVEIVVDSHDALGCLAQSIRKINRNNMNLTSTATAIGKGNFNIELEPRSNKDQLGHAIVDMQTELKNYNEKMQQLVEHRTEELARSNDDLQQFAHVASHDLKEPLRKITMFSHVLSQELQGDMSEKARQSLDKITAATARMSTMIEGVLAYSTVNFSEAVFEDVDLNQTLEGVLSDLEYAIAGKKATVQFESLPTIKGNAILLQQLFHNLINNALKFSREEAPPIIKIAALGILQTKDENGQPIPYYHLTVSDNGIGFNPQYSEKIFGIFSRLNAKEKYEGTGLGLALCRKIIDRHHGDIYAEGQEGKGATFHVLLPVVDEA